MSPVAIFVSPETTNPRDNMPVERGVRADRDAYSAGRDLSVVVQTLPFSVPRAAAPRDRSRPVFLQFLNPEIRSCYRKTYGVERDLAEVTYATRLAVLATDEYLVVPASYFFEVPVMAAFLERVDTLLRWGLLHYCSHIADFDAYIDHKVGEYRSDRHNPYAAQQMRAVPDLRWRPRYATSTAVDIAQVWSRAVARPDGLGGSVATISRRWPGGSPVAERQLAAVPDQLDGRAFLGRFVAPILAVPLSPVEAVQLDMFISRCYLASYLVDLDAAMVHDFTFGDLSCGVSAISGDLSDRLFSARQIERGLGWLGLAEFVRRSEWTELLTLRSTAEFGVVWCALVDPRQADDFRRAVLRARRRVRGAPVATVGEAKAVVNVVAEELEAGRYSQIRHWGRGERG